VLFVDGSAYVPLAVEGYRDSGTRTVGSSRSRWQGWWYAASDSENSIFNRGSSQPFHLSHFPPDLYFFPSCPISFETFRKDSKFPMLHPLMKRRPSRILLVGMLSQLQQTHIPPFSRSCLTLPLICPWVEFSFYWQITVRDWYPTRFRF
jgi:hypothetical protein